MNSGIKQRDLPMVLIPLSHLKNIRFYEAELAEASEFSFKAGVQF